MLTFFLKYFFNTLLHEIYTFLTFTLFSACNFSGFPHLFCVMRLRRFKRILLIYNTEIIETERVTKRSLID